MAEPKKIRKFKIASMDGNLTEEYILELDVDNIHVYTENKESLSLLQAIGKQWGDININEDEWDPAEGAETEESVDVKNLQPDWNEEDEGSIKYIQNKPKINDIDLTDYVKNTDYASNSKAGITIFADDSNLMNESIGKNGEIPYVPSTRLSFAIKRGLINGKGGWTDNEKSIAREVLGVASADKLNEETEVIYNILNQTVIGTEEITDTFNSRTTANGLSGLIDGSYARIEKVQGNSIIIFEDEPKLIKSQFQSIDSYSPYNEEGYYEHFDNISLEAAVDLGSWDYIDFNERKVVKQTSELLVLTGDEDWMLLNEPLGSDNKHSKLRFRVDNLVNGVSGNKKVNLITDYFGFSGYTATTPELTYWDNATDSPSKGVSVSGNYLHIFDEDYTIEYASEENTAEKRAEILANFKAHLKALYEAGTPLAIAYELATTTEESINIPKNKYKVWVGGEEILSNIGAAPTVTATYVVKRGGNA